MLDRLDDYKFVKLLGKGAYSEVILALQVSTNKLVAMKMIDKLFLEKVLVNFI